MPIPLDFKLKSSFSGLRVKIVQLSQKSYFFMGGNFAAGTVIFIVITFLLFSYLPMHIKTNGLHGLSDYKVFLPLLKVW